MMRQESTRPANRGNLRRPADFFYLNNGITAVAASIAQAAGNQDSCKFALTDLSVVNGAQTAGAIANAALRDVPADEAKVLITIIEIPPHDDFARQITRSRNYQTVVRGVDFAALDHKQERLRQELAVAGITYHYRPSAEARVRRDDAFTLEEGAIALACFEIPVVTRGDHAGEHALFTATDYVTAAKREIGRLWDEREGRYKRLFTDGLSGLRMYRCVQLYRFIDRIMAASERSETTYARRMFFRHARLFVMSFVADRSRDIVRRAELTISDADQQVLSRTIDEAAELIFSRSASLLAYKGYLSIFRNLTESQPLAADVVEQFRQRDAAQAPPQQPPGATAT